MSGLITFKEGFERLGGSLATRLFIHPKDPCEPRWAYVPGPEVPKHLMEDEAATVAEIALNQCMRVVGQWGDRYSLVNTQEFQNPAARFKEATGGVDAWEVISLARDRMLHLPNGY